MPFLKGISTNRFDEKSFGFCGHLHQLLMNIVKKIIISGQPDAPAHVYGNNFLDSAPHGLVVNWVGYLVFHIEYNVGIDVFPETDALMYSPGLIHLDLEERATKPPAQNYNSQTSGC